MTNDKTKQGEQDGDLVDIDDPIEVEYFHSKFPDKFHSQIIDAIKVAGPIREKIIRYLQGKA